MKVIPVDGRLKCAPEGPCGMLQRLVKEDGSPMVAVGSHLCFRLTGTNAVTFAYCPFCGVLIPEIEKKGKVILMNKGVK